MSKLKPVEEMTPLEVDNEILERRHDCGLNYNISRWALKWLRFEQVGIDAVLKDLHINREDIYDNGYYHSIVAKIVEEAERRAQPGLDWGDLVELLGRLKASVEIEAGNPNNIPAAQVVYEKEMQESQEWIDRLTAALGPFEDEPIELKESDRKEVATVPNKPKGFEGVHEWTWDGDGWTLKRIDNLDDRSEPIELKESDRKQAEELPKKPTPLDIDTPTLKRCGSRFFAQCQDSKTWIPIDLNTHVVYVAPSRLDGCVMLKAVCFDEDPLEAEAIWPKEEDARIIQNAWLELGR